MKSCTHPVPPLSFVSQNRQVLDCPNAKDRLRCNTGRRGVGCVCVPVCMYLGASSGCLSLCADVQWMWPRMWPHPWPGAAQQCIPAKKVGRRDRRCHHGGGQRRVSPLRPSPSPRGIRPGIAVDPSQVFRKRSRPFPGVCQELPPSRGFGSAPGGAGDGEFSPSGGRSRARRQVPATATAWAEGGWCLCIYLRTEV